MDSNQETKSYFIHVTDKIKDKRNLQNWKDLNPKNHEIKFWNDNNIQHLVHSVYP